ncbi:DUF6895 family protein [Streptomyces swartbergensis]|uniref:DUF6895 domain-containing protein n=1 Tax=Streptomyces swartbergensis TaxID=487165 RepID=A0A243RWG3_9ACTN|nr:hypothetical protein [Streptomyces swartbergensis]OUC99536.1 hypothetical protein CA983_27860 [Streptomyces swartbergensis]
MSAPPARADGPGTAGPGDSAVPLLTGVVRWLEDHLAWFDPDQWERLLPRRPFRPGALLELLGFLRLLDRAGHPRVPVPGALREGALSLAERVVDDPGFATSLRRADPYFPYHLNLVALLGILGRPRPALREDCLALLAVGAGGHTRPYKPVLNRLELRWFLDRAGLPAPPGLPGTAVLYAQSLPGLGPDPLSLDDSETYAFTHALFYATDFGAHALPPGGSDAGSLLEAVRLLLGVNLTRSHLDLVAELLLCADLLRPALPRHRDATGDDPVARGWAALAGAQRPDGAVPGPVHRPEKMSELAGEKAEAYLFGTCYHTTLAAGLAAAVRLGRRPGEGRVAPWPEPDRGTPQESALDPATPPDAAPGSDEIRRWAATVRATAAGASEQERAAWSARLDPLLVLCAQRYDRPALDAVLGAVRALGQGGTPLAQSVSALLSAGWCAPAPGATGPARRA